MSFTLYFQAYKNGIETPININQLVECFGQFVTEQNENGFKVEYNKTNSCFISIDLDKKQVDHFSIDRPCADIKLYNSIFEVAKICNLVQMEPDFDGFNIFETSTKLHLSEELLKMNIVSYDSPKTYMNRHND